MVSDIMTSVASAGDKFAFQSALRFAVVSDIMTSVASAGDKFAFQSALRFAVVSDTVFGLTALFWVFQSALRFAVVSDTTCCGCTSPSPPCFNPL